MSESTIQDIYNIKEKILSKYTAVHLYYDYVSTSAQSTHDQISEAKLKMLLTQKVYEDSMLVFKQLMHDPDTCCTHLEHCFNFIKDY